jgi:hypothetical protein
MLKNLDSRNYGGWKVFLNFNPDENRIEVRIESPEEKALILPPNNRALDCFNHPFAYVDKYGISSDQTEKESVVDRVNEYSMKA